MAVAKPFPDACLKYLENNVRAYAWLTEPEAAKLRSDIPVLIDRKYWEGCGGLKITDEIKVTIAGQACLLLLGIEHDYFSALRSILVYPTAYRAHERFAGPDGVVHEGDSDRAGEAWYRGPVVLAWDEVLVGGRNWRDGRNIVLHEFAHQLDFLDGRPDGTPPLKPPASYRTWCDVMTSEYQRLLEESEHGRATLMDHYGATDPAEFFAVATECFFEQPVQMKQRHLALYEVLRDYYGQDTAERFSRKPGRVR